MSDFMDKNDDLGAAFICVMISATTKTQNVSDLRIRVTARLFEVGVY